LSLLPSPHTKETVTAASLAAATFAPAGIVCVSRKLVLPTTCTFPSWPGAGTTKRVVEPPGVTTPMVAMATWPAPLAGTLVVVPAHVTSRAPLSRQTAVP
jgi:hypothetical protein